MLMILDTDHVSYLVKGDASVTQALADLGETPVAISVITVGELICGIKHRRSSRLEVAVEAFLSRADVLGIDEPIGRLFGEIRAHLWSIGHPIPDNDIWIASTAIRHGALLVARDEHYAYVPGLSVTSWVRRTL